MTRDHLSRCPRRGATHSDLLFSCTQSIVAQRRPNCNASNLQARIVCILSYVFRYIKWRNSAFEYYFICGRPNQCCVVWYSRADSCAAKRYLWCSLKCCASASLVGNQRWRTFPPLSKTKPIRRGLETGTTLTTRDDIVQNSVIRLQRREDRQQGRQRDRRGC